MGDVMNRLYDELKAEYGEYIKRTMQRERQLEAELQAARLEIERLRTASQRVLRALDAYLREREELEQAYNDLEAALAPAKE